MRARVLLLLSVIVLLLSSCTRSEDVTTLCIISDEYATTAVIDTDKAYVLVASMPVTALASYRGVLLREGISSDPFSAMRRLTGIDADIEISGDQSAWNALFQEGKREVLADRLTYLKQGTVEDISSAMKELSIEGVAKGKVDDLLSFYRESEYVLRVYQMSTFFTGRGESALLERNIQEWMIRTREEIELRSTE